MENMKRKWIEIGKNQCIGNQRFNGKYSGQKPLFFPPPQNSNPYFFPVFFASKIRLIAREIGILRDQILLAADFGANVVVLAYILIENAFVEEIRVFWFDIYWFFITLKKKFRGQNPYFFPVFQKNREGPYFPYFVYMYIITSCE